MSSTIARRPIIRSISVKSADRAWFDVDPLHLPVAVRNSEAVDGPLVDEHFELERSVKAHPPRPQRQGDRRCASVYEEPAARGDELLFRNAKANASEVEPVCFSLDSRRNRNEQRDGEGGGDMPPISIRPRTAT